VSRTGDVIERVVRLSFTSNGGYTSGASGSSSSSAVGMLGEGRLMYAGLDTLKNNS
jgi:hypothetical protein